MKLIDSSVWKIVYRRGLRTRDTRKQVLKCKDIAHPVSIITLVSISSRFRDFEISRFRDVAALDLGTVQRFRFILKALCRQTLCAIDIPTALSPNFREYAYAANVADF